MTTSLKLGKPARAPKNSVFISFTGSENVHQSEMENKQTAVTCLICTCILVNSCYGNLATSLFTNFHNFVSYSFIIVFVDIHLIKS